MDNVVLISGDVHHANLHEAQCNFTGQKILPEFTSSGLSHTLKDFFPAPEEMFRFMDLPEARSKGEMFMDYNYGALEIMT